VVDALLAAGADAHAITEAAVSVLHAAAAGLDAHVVSRLLQLGVDPGLTDGDGRAPLHVVSLPEAVWSLVGAGADIEARDGRGATALHAATRRSHGGVVVALLDAGAAIDARDSAGDTPLHGATERNDIPMLELLLRRGADRAVQNARGETAADIATNDLHEDALALLSGEHSEAR
jgi:ankyrin repeat protein